MVYNFPLKYFTIFTRFLKKPIMKKSLLILFFAIIFSSCKSTLPLNQSFYDSGKVGVVLQMDSISMAKEGGQGLLDMALTPGNRFTEALLDVDSQISAKVSIKNKISRILGSKGKAFKFIEEPIDYEQLDKFKKPNSKYKYSKLDYREFKTKYNVDELWILDVDYGLLVSYYGFVELDKKGFVFINSEVINLNNNVLLQKNTFQSKAKIDGNWKGGEEYSNLKEAVEEAIKESGKILDENF